MRKGMLVVAAGFAAVLLWPETGRVQTFGRRVLDQPVRVVRTADGRSILLTVPAQAEARRFRDRLSALAPDETEGSARRILAPRALSLVQDTSSSHEVQERSAVFADPVTGARYEVHWLALGQGASAAYFGRPEDFDVLPRPGRPHELLIERGFALYLVEATTGAVTPLGDPEERKAFLARVGEKAEQGAEGLTTDGGDTVAAWASSPAWSPDGRFVGFVTTRDTLETNPSLSSVWLHDMETGQERPLVRSSPGRIIVPRAFGATGELLADVYAGERVSMAGIAPRTGALRDLGHGSFAALAPDGRRVAAVRGERRGNLELVVIDLERPAAATTIAKESSRTFLRSQEAVFSQDGRVVTDLETTRGDQSLVVFDTVRRRGRSHPVPRGSTLAAPVGWTGARLVVPIESRARGTAGTFVLDVE